MTIDREARENRILAAIVKTHIESALPVSSKYIARILNLSSATIRSVMFELEKKNLIWQPHISAGRIPTDLGYRRYVDNIIFLGKLPTDDDIFFGIRRYLTKKRFFEEVIEATSHAISEITRYTGIALSPSNKLYFDGTYHMLEQPEFNQLQMARDFLKIIEEKNELLRIMSQDLKTIGTKIRIGRENAFEELKGCTIITSTYRLRRHIAGNIGIIGPMRMRYEKVVPIVEHLAEMTTDFLEEISG